MPKIILDLCGGTGAWSAPYKTNGYEVILVDINFPPYIDILNYEAPKDIYGILAAPPCTDFSGAGSRHWKKKDADGRTEYSISLVKACLRIIKEANPSFWALENPPGRIKKLVPEIGDPILKFNPCDYGDPYSKLTYVWGKFNIPKKLPRVSIDYSSHYVDANLNYIDRTSGIASKYKYLRSITSPGFAFAFYLVNT